MYNNFGEGLEKVKTVCINLRRRRDRKIKMKKLLKKNKLKFSFFTGFYDCDNGSNGARKSHLAVIKKEIENGTKQLLIIEDDIKIIGDLKNLEKPPTNWDILYFGGEVLKKHQSTDKHWTLVSNLNCHAYILNLENKEMVEELFKAPNFKMPYDFYIRNKIQTKFLTYMYNPMLIIQQNGFSECEQKFIDYSLMKQSMDGFKKPEFETKSGNYVLKLDKLQKYPHVSIITPTFNRRNMFPMAIKNFNDFNYPKDKLQWVIVEDSTNGETVEDLLPPNDSRIKYIKLDKWIPTMGMKRNICIEHTDHDIIVHMDDDDYYPSESIYSRVAALINYAEKGIQLIGSSQIGVYDIINDKSNLSGDGEFSIAEGTMCYFKHFWMNKKFNNKSKAAEYRDFIGGRFNKILDIPYSFIMIAFKHGLNTVTKEVGQGIMNKSSQTDHSFLEDMDEETQMFVGMLKTYIQNKSKIETPDFDELELEMMT